ncbi:MAG: hypothetical protein ACOYEI_05305 [Acetivibrionales bacterium]|nr:hypothetical protein [Clostridiaceae bacterium]
MEKLFLIDKDKIGILKDQDVSKIESDYLQNYRKNAAEIIKKNEWKMQGVNAAFREERSRAKNPEDIRGSINGISLLPDGNKLLYTVSVENFSGVFIKHLDHADTPDSHILHDSKASFSGVDCHGETGEVVMSVRQTSVEKNLALLDIDDSHFSFITEGDTQDDNPVWSKTQKRTIYYDSAGIGRDYQGNFVALGPKSINKLDLDRCTVDEIVEIPEFDCFKPQTDKDNNLYFIKRPYQSNHNKKPTFIEIITIPFKILKAIGKAIEFFTVRHTGEAFTSKGFNPSKAKTMDPKEIIINENIINVEKTYKENKLSGQPYPGIAPKSWELMCLDNKGTMHSVKKGVLGYTINSDGQITYSNGKYIIQLSPDGKEEVLQKIDFIDRLIMA